MVFDAADNTQTFSRAYIALLRGVVYGEGDPPLWQAMMHWQSRIRDEGALIGLELVLDEPEGYAYLRQRQQVEGEPELPRLIPKRQLGFPVSLLLALLRKKLAESDAKGGDSRLILSRDDIAELMKVFLPPSANEAKLLDKLDGHINKAADLGFLRRLKGDVDRFEVRRILKAFVDAQWLQEFDSRLEEYRRHLLADFSADNPFPDKEGA